ncbi:DeoR family transcriptional regulator [Candidatus Woesearchaeota archaeon]|nr:DeoR family transcriptional regulator [Candidatus Woesearchaeota archaeon]
MLNKVKEINFRQANILEEFMSNPGKILTLEEVSRTYNVVYQTARNDLLSLTEKGYLTMIKIGRKFVFTFTEKNQERLKNIN